MLIGDPLDTLMNLTAFAFIAAMVWLMVRPLAPPEPPEEEIDDPPSPER